VKQDENVYSALSDYIAPKDSGREDYMGAFACTAGLGQDELVAKYQAEHDDFSIMMLKSLTD
jgi:5-methyltetrahydrofolate--homocysteine methyltransferase